MKKTQVRRDPTSSHAHNYIPCDHPGVKCDDSCRCVQVHFCEKFCQCSPDCEFDVLLLLFNIGFIFKPLIKMIEAFRINSDLNDNN